ncbi:hypothetical protein HD597_010047 [Nonomuraea thailandensis]|uniref:Uncharacterized protein n=1 Tax=Nonomuraea thailandensis TaxID=1188745 RepID=A0A9X2GSF5_9ACTN|nr:hypothetical protein [Nonomuraea thailandensis]MCP2363027.1 hypothetical protein [Nonomuraea thailandensis]
MPLSQQAPLPRVIDERPRTIRLKTPRHSSVSAELGGAGDPVKIQIKVSRPLDMVLGMNTAPVLDLSSEEAWALWAVLGDGLGAMGDPPHWAAGPLPAYGPNGRELPPAPTALPREPF